MKQELRQLDGNLCTGQGLRKRLNLPYHPQSQIEGEWSSGLIWFGGLVDESLQYFSSRRLLSGLDAQG